MCSRAVRERLPPRSLHAEPEEPPLLGEDQALFDEAKAADDGFRVPAFVIDAELNGAHPVHAWRDFRGLTQQALSNAAGISKPYLSQIESGKRAGTAKVLAAIARALDVPVDLLVRERNPTTRTTIQNRAWDRKKRTWAVVSEIGL